MGFKCLTLADIFIHNAHKYAYIFYSLEVANRGSEIHRHVGENGNYITQRYKFNPSTAKSQLKSFNSLTEQIQKTIPSIYVK